MQINEITTTIIIVISILIMTSGTGILSSLVFAQTDSEDAEDPETDLANLTLTNSSEVQVDSSGTELPQQQQPQYNISQNEQCSARVQSFMQKAQDAMNTGEYGQWRSMSDPEVQQLNKECPEQMQGQQ
jgi:hypothetical protein